MSQRPKNSTSVSCKLSPRDYQKFEMLCALNNYERSDFLKMIIGQYFVKAEKEKKEEIVLSE
jgi:hypothetical protein